MDWGNFWKEERSHCLLWVTNFAPCSDFRLLMPQVQSNAHVSCTPLLSSRTIWPRLCYQSRGCYYIHPLLNPGKNALRSAPNYFTSSPQPCWKSPQITKLIGSTLLPYVVCKRSSEVYLGIRTNITALYEDFTLALITKASPAFILLHVACPTYHSTLQHRVTNLPPSWFPLEKLRTHTLSAVLLLTRPQRSPFSCSRASFSRKVLQAVSHL